MPVPDRKARAVRVIAHLRSGEYGCATLVMPVAIALGPPSLKCTITRKDRNASLPCWTQHARLLA